MPKNIGRASADILGLSENIGAPRENIGGAAEIIGGVVNNRHKREKGKVAARWARTVISSRNAKQ